MDGAAGQTAERFCDQLRRGLEDFEHALQQVPGDRLYATPPASDGENALGEWPPARHVFHLDHYEHRVPIPILHTWLDEPYPHYEGPDEDAAWQNARDIQHTLESLRRARDWQIELIERVQPAMWNQAHELGRWGRVSLRWVTTKTVQHTHEHINAMLKFALHWDQWEAEAKAKRP
ncbi:MAG: DinB family protein [Dehalococcoidia bacterium]